MAGIWRGYRVGVDPPRRNRVEGGGSYAWFEELSKLLC